MDARRRTEGDVVSAKSLGRRLFAKATMGVPTVLKFAAGTAPPVTARYGDPTRAVDVGGITADDVLRANIWQSLRLKMRPEEERRDARYARRRMMGGLDPDLAVMNSMALQHRIVRQIERETAEKERHRSLRGIIISALGGKPEDFE